MGGRLVRDFHLEAALIAVQDPGVEVDLKLRIDDASRGGGTAFAGQDDYATRDTTITRDTDTTRDAGTTRDDDGAMTRSEERLNVGRESQAVGRARLRKYITTENVTTTVPVERVRLERDTVTGETRR